MLTRDPYVAILEKRAAAESSIPPNDSAEATNAEFNQNQEDNKQYLNATFGQAGAVASNMAATKKLFSREGVDTVVGHPLLKMASRELFFNSLQQRGLLKTASAIHLEVAYNSFCDELEKIAAIKPQTLAQVAQKNQVAMSRPAKVWNISSPASAAGAGAKPSLPQGSGTSVHSGGILARLGLK